MTLSPVFRSSQAVSELVLRGYWDQLAPSLSIMRDAKRAVLGLLDEVIDGRFVSHPLEIPDDNVFLQEHFFLILFDSVYRSVGCDESARRTFARLNLCIKGLVVAGDNLFDGESKMELPLSLGAGRCFASIMQLLCFDRLLMRLADEPDSCLNRAQANAFGRSLLSRLASIGELEGSEEGGIANVPPIDEMIRLVHGVRGGELFALAFVGPQAYFGSTDANRWSMARSGVSRLGTAFQIVDDVTDFEFDVTRGSHNLLVSQIVHHGSSAERQALKQLQDGADVDASNDFGRRFADSAWAVLRRATTEAERGFQELRRVGFWFQPADAELFVQAIAGDAGEPRMKALATASGG